MNLPQWVSGVGGEALTAFDSTVGTGERGLVAFRFEPVEATGSDHAAVIYRATVAAEHANWLVSVCHLAGAQIGVRATLGSVVAVNDADDFVVVVEGLPRLSSADLIVVVDCVYRWLDDPNDVGGDFQLLAPSQALTGILV